MVTTSIRTRKGHRKPKKEKPFYGWRYLKVIRPDGTEDLEQVPLTLEDVLHPQEGDHIPQNFVHQIDQRYLSNVCDARESRLEHGLVLTDCIIDWGVTGLANHCPDISAFEKLKKRPPKSFGIFRVRTFGGRCVLGVEIVSPDTRRNDVKHKLVEYHQAKVKLYVIIDQKKENGPRELRAYRYKAAGYEKVELDRRGRVLVKHLGIRIGLENNRVVCFDAETDQELGDYAQIEQVFIQSEQARVAAEKQAIEQAEARQAAELAQQAAELAQQAAERARQTEELARRTAEKRVLELETELRRLRGESNK